MDLLTGCFEGCIYLMEGISGGGYKKPERVLDMGGDILRVGKYWDYDQKKWTTVKKSAYSSSLGISVAPVDWDDDGDLDLILGTNEGKVLLRLNAGDAKNPAFARASLAIKVDEEDMKVPEGQAMPVVADWDNDGLWDLVSGSKTGGVYWFRNMGSKGDPVFAEPVRLVDKTNRSQDTHDPQRSGLRAQVAVTDFDNDGDQDLVVGDYNSIRNRETGKRIYDGWVWLYRRN